MHTDCHKGRWFFNIKGWKRAVYGDKKPHEKVFVQVYLIAQHRVNEKITKHLEES